MQQHLLCSKIPASPPFVRALFNALTSSVHPTPRKNRRFENQNRNSDQNWNKYQNNPKNDVHPVLRVLKAVESKSETESESNPGHWNALSGSDCLQNFNIHQPTILKKQCCYYCWKWSCVFQRQKSGLIYWQIAKMGHLQWRWTFAGLHLRQLSETYQISNLVR